MSPHEGKKSKRKKLGPNFEKSSKKKIFFLVLRPKRGQIEYLFFPESEKVEKDKSFCYFADVSTSHNDQFELILLQLVPITCSAVIIQLF